MTPDRERSLLGLVVFFLIVLATGFFARAWKVERQLGQLETQIESQNDKVRRLTNQLTEIRANAEADRTEDSVATSASAPVPDEAPNEALEMAENQRQAAILQAGLDFDRLTASANERRTWVNALGARVRMAEDALFVQDQQELLKKEQVPEAYVRENQGIVERLARIDAQLPPLQTQLLAFRAEAAAWPNLLQVRGLESDIAALQKERVELTDRQRVLAEIERQRKLTPDAAIADARAATTRELQNLRTELARETKRLEEAEAQLTSARTLLTPVAAE